MSALACCDLAVDLGAARVLDGVSFSVAPGEWLALVGPNGAGKTTLLRAIAGLVRYDGRIEIDGTESGSLSRRDRARRIAVVPQTPVVPAAMLVADYVLLGRTPHIPTFGGEGADDLAAATRAIEQMGLDDLMSRSLGTLSGGERQRAVIARALTQQPEILLLDEPTTALDLGHQQQMLELVDELRRGHDLTVVSAMHDLTLAGQYADSLVLIDHGRIQITGSAAVVLTEENLARFYGARVRVIPGSDDASPIVVPHRASSR